MRPRLVGEVAGMPDAAKVLWRSAEEEVQPLTWYRAEFALDPTVLHEDSDYRIAADGMGKGAMFLNGHAVGRYWLIDASSSDMPSQLTYHVPRNWLKSHNEIVLFEEQARRRRDLPWSGGLQIIRVDNVAFLELVTSNMETIRTSQEWTLCINRSANITVP